MASGQWDANGIQIQFGIPVCGDDGWIQVALPQAVSCTHTAVIGWSGSHMPSGSNGAYVQASADGTSGSWTTVGQWTNHPGASQAYIHLGEYSVSDVDSRLTSDLGVTLSGSNNAYKYWRVGGTGWTNGWMLIMEWFLACSVLV